MNKCPGILFLLCIFNVASAHAQLITGYWKGKIDRKNVELKIIKNGDSLTGTSYYYESANSYRRYSIKGYFDDRDNSVVWWDDVLLEEKGSKNLLSAKKLTPYLSNADFNCPGGTKMYLDGKAATKEKEDEPNKPVALEKFDTHIFKDEWDEIIDNYTVGANDPELINSVSQLAFKKEIPVEPTVATTTGPMSNTQPVIKKEPIKKQVTVAVTKKEPVAKPVAEPVKQPVIIAPLTNQEKFISRTKKFMQEIPISGDSVELRFYDNAEVDGDSIAIFLNNKLLYEHVLLSDKPYSIKLPVASLQQSNELVMVAENLGSIPPNTSLMVAVIDGKHYEARLESTEQSSALIRFVRQ